MKRVMVLTLLAVGLSGVTLGYAEDGQAAAPSPPGIVAGFLGFSEDQAAGFGQLLGSLQQAMQTLQPQISAQQKKLNDLAGAANPDPASVGAAFLTLRALQGQLEQAMNAYQQGFQALLTPEQQQKMGAVAQAAHLVPVVGAFVALNLVPPPR